MHLKRLEAYGFKSFADKLQLDFTTGVTCIVGPNGCGKSNVCDSIKWVLGEQNARNIRSGGQGKTMQEVIFKGTNNRKPMGYCEVSLFFDNSDRAYKVDYEELIITRKLFRSGDSEYYINGKRAKLKEIIDLFRDTGIGKDGYSVVGQGQIDAILSAKPEDRRQIFEEAAGISKYKANRKEAFGRLEKSLFNIRSLDEQMRVLEDVIKPLRVQAEV
ncbi:MAG: AAA family ATPase, partial [Clostridia bacterium]|nr:AAA family ATPase [Clostridia bacterium]